MVRRRFKRASPAGASQGLSDFYYADEQWAAIEKELREGYRKAFKKELSQADLTRARWQLGRSALGYFLVERTGPGKTNAQRKEWAEIAENFQTLIQIFFNDEWPLRIGRPELSPFLSGKDWKQPLVRKTEWLKLLNDPNLRLHFKLKHFADLVTEGNLITGSKVKARTWFQFDVLEVWISFGLKPKYSRVPGTGRIIGPLARYFLAATQPVYTALGQRHGSLESLAYTVRRRQALKADVEGILAAILKKSEHWRSVSRWHGPKFITGS
jgi:hypothetical protein